MVQIYMGGDRDKEHSHSEVSETLHVHFLPETSTDRQDMSQILTLTEADINTLKLDQ